MLGRIAAVALHNYRESVRARILLGLAGVAFAVVQVPSVTPRLVALSGETGVPGLRRAYALIEDVIARHVGALFPGLRVRSVSPCRVTRNFDLDLDEAHGGATSTPAGARRAMQL